MNKYGYFLVLLFLMAGTCYPLSIPQQEAVGLGDKTVSGELINSAFTRVDQNKYILGAGDRLFVSAQGVNNRQYELTVNPEGYVFIPNIGLIEIAGRNLAEGKKIISDKIESYYKDVNVEVTLSGVRMISVDMIGFVNEPSSYDVPATSRLSDLIRGSNAAGEGTDLRNVKVIKKNNDTLDIDLIEFYRLGTPESNPFLFGGDIVKLKKATEFVSVMGEALYPGRYSYRPGESAKHLLTIAGGILDGARKDSVELIRFTGDKLSLYSEYYSYDRLMEGDVILKNGDKIVIRGIPDYLTDRTVLIEGEIRYPGVYKIVKDKTDLYDLVVNEAGGFLETASLQDSYVMRTDTREDTDPELERLKTIPRADMTEDEYDYFKARSREKKGRMIVDFVRLFEEKDKSENIILKRGDKIVVPEKKNYVTVVGQVVNGGNIIYSPEMKIDDYIRSAGGFAWRAIEDEVRVIKSSTGEWIESDDVKNLQPGDIIWVPEEPPGPKFWDVFIDALTVFGQVAAIVASVTAIIIATGD